MVVVVVVDGVTEAMAMLEEKTRKRERESGGFSS